MSRRIKQTYHCQPLAALARQLLVAPASKRVAQVRRAERLHDEIEPAQAYPLDFLTYRLTGYRPETAETVLLVGEAVQPDLRLLIDQLSRSVTIERRDGELIETAEQLAARLGVSTKTLVRWRKAGLRWRWMALEGGERKQVVFTREAVECFARRHPQRVEQAAAFTAIGPQQRQRILEQARHLAGGGEATLNQVATRIAHETGRGLETIRQILEKHDRTHPDEAIFPDRRGPLTDADRRAIVRQRRRGASTGELMRAFGRTRSTIYRVINLHRAEVAHRLPLRYATLTTFTRADADEVLFAPRPRVVRQGGQRPALDELPAAAHPLFDRRPLTGQMQQSLLVRYNYLKFKADRIRVGLDPRDPRRGELDRFRRTVRQARRLRHVLVVTALPEVLAVARQHQPAGAAGSLTELAGLLEVGIETLAEAVDAFDISPRRSFRSFLSHRLMQRFAAAGADHPQRARRRTDEHELAQRLCLAAAREWINLTPLLR